MGGKERGREERELNILNSDFGFATGNGGTCTVSGTLPPSPPAVCIGTYEKSQGYVEGGEEVKKRSRQEVERMLTFSSFFSLVSDWCQEISVQEE